MRQSEKRIFLTMGILMIILYITGVFTGFFLYESSVESTHSEITNLQKQIDGYRQTLEYIRLEQLYMSSPNKEISCKFMLSSIKNIQRDLSYFIKNLPGKLEIYEKYNGTDPAYENLKRDYMFISLKSWMLSLSVKERCNADIIPILYFYSRECDKCIEQGFVLDRIREENPNAFIFTIDFNLNEEWANVIKEAYNIKETPSLIIGNTTYSGFVDYDELDKTIRNSY
ncbi:MAG TPA: thioredoxin [Candidatus Aenigmarchaeota archaeon]|nr:thioredoxin [Candidatus Aenigmarchaeota archaeon]